MTSPHYLRFARTLALVGSIGGVACTAACTTATTPGTDTGPSGTDAATADTGTTEDAASAEDTGTDAAVATVDANEPDAFFDCASCQCGFTADDAGLPSCEPDHAICCAAVGPLAPPDLAA